MATQALSSILSSSSLTENNVKNRQGEDLGSIKDLMICTESGRVVYAVLSFGGLLGFGDKLFAVPFKALTIDRSDECCVLDVDKECLENAHGFDKDDWPDMADQRWQTEVHTAYGVQPYWKD